MPEWSFWLLSIISIALPCPTPGPEQSHSSLNIGPPVLGMADGLWTLHIPLSFFLFPSFILSAGPSCSHEPLPAHPQPPAPSVCSSSHLTPVQHTLPHYGAVDCSLSRGHALSLLKSQTTQRQKPFLEPLHVLTRMIVECCAHNRRKKCLNIEWRESGKGTRKDKFLFNKYGLPI